MPLSPYWPPLLREHLNLMESTTSAKPQFHVFDIRDSKKQGTNFEVWSELIFEEKWLLCFQEKHFSRSLITQGQSQEHILEKQWKRGRE